MTGEDMPVIVQIYGLTDLEDADIVVEAGADHAGVVVREDAEATWDSVDVPTGRALAARLREGGVKVVGLSLARRRDDVLRAVDVLEPDVVHLARAVGHLAPDDLDRLPVGLMVTIPVAGAEAVGDARAYAGVADWLLLDSAHPATGVVGATGLVHDWSVSRAVVDAVRGTVPVVLAGGLGPDNVVEAIQTVRPDGVDSETRTSRVDDRRRKDRHKVRRFVTAAKRPAP